MASSFVLEQVQPAETIRQLVFAGDGVRLAGQVDYPKTPPDLNGSYPLLFILHSSGWNTRREYEHYTRIALDCGFAVFRWDKRGTGRSGGGGRGSTTQDAVLAYETALDQPHIDSNRVVILAQGEGSVMFGNAYGLFARHQTPAGVILVGNMLDEEAILAIESRIQIINGGNDWLDWGKYACAACDAHQQTYHYGASYYVANDANRALVVGSGKQHGLHFGAMKALRNWLRQFGPVYS